MNITHLVFTHAIVPIANRNLKCRILQLHKKKNLPDRRPELWGLYNYR